jgi:CRISPR-associated endonuclease Cas3-HD
MTDNNLLAHSARYGYPPQAYRDHVNGVIERAAQAAAEVAGYTRYGRLFEETVRTAAAYHDLGKLAPADQNILRGMVKTGGLLPDHWDAGAALLIRDGAYPAAACIMSHHRGLPSLPGEQAKQQPFRSNDIQVRRDTDINLSRYLQDHVRETGPGYPPVTGRYRGRSSCGWCCPVWSMPTTAIPPVITDTGRIRQRRPSARPIDSSYWIDMSSP